MKELLSRKALDWYDEQQAGDGITRDSFHLFILGIEQDAVAPWRDHPAAIDTKALATAQEIALMWGQDRTQFVARIQVAVTEAMLWIREGVK